MKLAEEKKKRLANLFLYKYNKEIMKTTFTVHIQHDIREINNMQ